MINFSWKTAQLILALFCVLFCIGGIFPPHVSAHEQYVLTKQELAQDMTVRNVYVFDALKNATNLGVAVKVGIGVTIAGILIFLFQTSPLGRKIGRLQEKLDPVGHVLLRIAFACSLLASAYFHSFLGPEIPITSLPLGALWIPIMYIAGIFLFVGLFTGIVASIALLILLGATLVYGEYMMTYFNYYGELIALVIFGSYVLSVDNKLFGVSRLVTKYKDFEMLLIRVTYGISVMYPAITLKLFHPAVIIDIVNKYHMNQIHWLFPSDPLLISLGTGLAQIAVGLMIIFGFETRFASFTTFLLYLLSVMFFKEAVWPHYILLSLALYITINGGGRLTIDRVIENFIEKHFENKKKSTKGSRKG